MTRASDDFLMLIVSSPSGAGKTTLCNRLRGELPELRFCVSHTTRRPAAGRGRRARLPLRRRRARSSRWCAPARSPSGRGSTATSTAPACAEIETRPGRLRRRDLRHRLPGRAADQGCAPRRGRRLHPPALARRARAPPPRPGHRGRGHRGPPPRQRQDERSSTTASSTTSSSTTTSTAPTSELRGIVLAERCRRARHARLCERMLARRKADPVSALVARPDARPSPSSAAAASTTSSASITSRSSTSPPPTARPATPSSAAG